MTLARIAALMPPPARPRDTTGDWSAVEAGLGTTLPAEYKAFLSLYGAGLVSEFLWIFNPLSRNPYLNTEMIFYFRDCYLQLKTEFPEYCPRDPDSFLTWAMTIDGDSFFWAISGDAPDGWTVGIQSRDQSCEDMTGLTTVAFLEALVEGRLETPLLPQYFLDEKKTFAPH